MNPRRRARWWLALVLTAAAGVQGQSLTNTIATLQTQVNTLPATNTPQQLKKAVLNLALEQASNCVSVNDLTAASNRVADVQGALNNDPDVMAAMAVRTNIGSLVLPLVTNGNPYLDVMNAGVVSTLASADSVWGKNTLVPTTNEVLGPITLNNAYNPRNVGKILEAYLFQFVNPASTNQGRAEIASRFLRRAHAYADNVDVHDTRYTPGSYMYDDFAIGPFACAIREFAWLYPGLVLPSQKAVWDRAMTKAGAKMWTKATTDVWRGSYANIDLAQAYQLLNFGLYLTNQAYLDKARWLVDVRTNDLFADGAWAYIWSQNESHGYHSTDTDYLGRYWLISGYPLCTNLLQRSEWYALVSNPRLGEFWTAPSWKQLWNAALPDTGGEQAVAFSGNPYVRWMRDQYFLPAAVGNPNDWLSRRWDVSFYRNEVTGIAPPTNFTVFDANTLGPRSQQARFAYAATGRRIRDTEPGHYTLMGAGIAQSTGNLWDAMVLGVYPRVRANLSTNMPTTDPSNNGWMRDWAWLTTQLTNDHTLGREFSALSATYRLHRYASSSKGAELNWRGRQMWLGLPERIIGWLSVAPDGVNATAYEVDGIVRLGTGGTVASPAKTLQNLGGNTNFRYGDLRVTLHDHSFGTVTTPIVPFRLTQYPTVEITLRDPRSIPFNGTNLLTYTTNDEYHFVVEVRAVTTPGPATVTRHMLANGLRTLTATVSGAEYLLIHNPGATPLTYSNSIACAWSHAAWFSGWQSQGRRIMAVPVSGGQATVATTIPARGQIVFVNSADVSLLDLGPTSGTAFFTLPPPQPVMTNANLVDSEFVVTGNNGIAGGTYHVLSATNLSMPATGWTPIATNAFGVGGGFSFTLPVAATSAQQFIRLKQP